MLQVYDRYDSRLNSTFQITVDTWGVVPQWTYTYLISLTVDIDWLIHSQVSTGERGGCCWNRSGSHHGSCCQSNYRLLHHRRQRGRWVLSVLFPPSQVGLLIPASHNCRTHQQDKATKKPTDATKTLFSCRAVMIKQPWGELIPSWSHLDWHPAWENKFRQLFFVFLFTLNPTECLSSLPFPILLSLIQSAGVFALNETTGVISTARPLDYEANSSFVLKVEADSMRVASTNLRAPSKSKCVAQRVNSDDSAYFWHWIASL